MTLDALQIGNTSYISSINLSEELRRRLLELGMIAGTEVKCVLKTSSNDMAAYSIRGSVFGIRADDARYISVNCKL